MIMKNTPRCEPIFELIIDDTIVPGYYISKFGNVYKLSNTDLLKSIKLSKNTNNGRLVFNIIFSPTLFGYSYASSGSHNKCSRQVYLHKALMNTFRPIDEFPPISKAAWKKTPKEAKQLIKDCILINHIDHNYLNNDISNLEYATPMQNSHAAVKHYNGNTANAKKFKYESNMK